MDESKSGFHFHFPADSRRFPGDWPVWPSDLGHELIMRKVGPFPTCCSPFLTPVTNLWSNSSFEV